MPDNFDQLTLLTQKIPRGFVNVFQLGFKCFLLHFYQLKLIFLNFENKLTFLVFQYKMPDTFLQTVFLLY